MGLQIPNYIDPHTKQKVTAYARIVGLNVNFEREMGTVALRIWASKEAYDAGSMPYSETVQFRAGRDGFPSLTVIASSTPEAWGAIDNYLYNQIALQPQFTGATQI